MVNPRDDRARSEAEMITRWAAEHHSLAGHVLFATSGSTGGSKWVALSRTALLASATAVNNHLCASPADRWLLALPDFHVGGMGILARCYQSSCQVVSLHEKWSARAYHALACAEQVTLSSLVPTQLVDLVYGRLPAPPSLRAVLIGGGRLEKGVYQKALDLDWPVMETYGMTETSSQVATASLTSRSLKVLPCWQTKITEEGRLMVQGEPALTGYVSCDGGVCRVLDPKEAGWFRTGDIVDLQGDTLVVKGRADRCVKIMGELVNLAEVESALIRCAQTGDVLRQNLVHQDIVVTAVPDRRNGYRLIACCDHEMGLDDLIDRYNATCHPVCRIDSGVLLVNIPRGTLGKVAHAQLARMVVQAVTKEG
jgi:O-succinylbenzoic acid--CoA ligase